LVAGLRRNYLSYFHKMCGKVAHGPRKEPLDAGGNPDPRYVTVEFGLRLGGISP